MNQGPLIFLGILATLATSWWGLVVAPQLQLGRQEPVLIEATDQLYPVAAPGMAAQGKDVYQANGCYYCHSQQVLRRDMGADFERGWGLRPSVSQDYLRDQPVLLGTQRIGPDLANIGVRQPDPRWHLMHLYNPRLTSPGSIMPPYRYLFETRKIKGAPSPDALQLEGDDAPPPGYEVVPKPDAVKLVAYLRSLQEEKTSLFEAPLPQPAGTNAAPGSATNAVPAGATNATAAGNASAPDTNAAAASSNSPAQ